MKCLNWWITPNHYQYNETLWINTVPGKNKKFSFKMHMNVHHSGSKFPLSYRMSKDKVVRSWFRNKNCALTGGSKDYLFMQKSLMFLEHFSSPSTQSSKKGDFMLLLMQCYQRLWIDFGKHVFFKQKITFSSNIRIIEIRLPTVFVSAVKNEP